MVTIVITAIQSWQLRSLNSNNLTGITTGQIPVVDTFYVYDVTFALGARGVYLYLFDPVRRFQPPRLVRKQIVSRLSKRLNLEQIGRASCGKGGRVWGAAAKRRQSTEL